MKKYTLSLLFSFSAIQNSFALNCDAILQHGLRNITITSSSEATVATKYFNHCHKDFSSLSESTIGSLEVEIFGYVGGDGNLSLSKRSDRLNDWCKTNSTSAKANHSAYEESQIIYGQAVTAWESCNKLDADGLKTNFFITPDSKNVDIGIRFVPSGTDSTTIELYNVISKGFDCTVTGPGGSNIELPTNIGNKVIAISCERKKPNIVKRESGEYEFLESGLITIQTANNPFQLFFPSEEKPTISTANAERILNRIIDLENSNSTLIQTLSAIKSGESPVQRAITADSAANASHSASVASGHNHCRWIDVGVVQPNTIASCPSGFYISGIQQDYDGGKGSFRVWTGRINCCKISP